MKKQKDMSEKEIIRVSDNRGFYYDVTLEHRPRFGFSTAWWFDRIIGQVELGRILQPTSDDDREWEIYEERFSEWTDEIKTNIIPICQEYFNKRD